MDTPRRAHRRRGGGLRLPNLALVASFFASASAALVNLPPTRASLPQLHRRLDGEHVVLADCRDNPGLSATLSSQMAYFTGAVGPNPYDVAIVNTSPGQTALWVNSVTKALFTTSSVTFTAELGPRVEEGQFAGTGDNGYGNFSCYQRYVKDLYTYGNIICSQVYLCDHSTPPTTTPTPQSTSSSSSMSQGTIIGIAVGVVGGVLFLVATALVIWYFRRSRRNRAEAAPSSSELLRSTTMSPGPASEVGELKATQTPAAAPASPVPVVQSVSAVYEMDGRLFRIEMANDHGKFELDPEGHGSAELAQAKVGEGSSAVAAAGITEIPEEGTMVSPVSPSALGFPPEGQTPQTPQGPPPEYSQTSKS